MRGNSISARMQLSVYTSENKLNRSFSDLAPSDDKIRSRNKQLLVLSPSSIHSRKITQMKGRQLAPGGFKGQSNDTSNKDTDDSIAIPTRYSSTTSTKQSLFNSKRNLLNASPATLDYAALDLRYGNVILIIKKLASAPELISDDLRDYLYDMLPASIKNRLRAKLKIVSKSLGSTTYDTSF
ncbi:Hypothetical predicted protein [Olea europaea subsp. europaea]|uniref:DUF668 domain-containing protein n=1 Tax=Olea europaea subsp. europaea TaxID=158383 RepID=A0A8S0RUN9_OLEEU|nr:Hypothetical predicted protein [Olea europaea subsp. europaea]